MSGLSRNVVDNFNKIIDSLKDSAAKLNQQVMVSLYTFGGKIDTLISHQPIAQVPKLTYDSYRPDGGTPMFECAWRAVTDLQSKDGADVANLLTILTDGEENQSTMASKQAFIGSIKGLMASDRWTITFSVPSGYSRNVTSHGILPGNVQEWEVGTIRGLEVASNTLAASYGNYLVGRSTGLTSSKNFFTAGVNAQQAQAAKQNLTDVRKDFKEMTVRTQDPKVIQQFIEARGHTFMKGRAFYQLTKAEKVQNHKEVLLREIKSGAIYGGAQARQILGLPDWQDVKVKPEEHGDWEVFVQSTSNNRKLMVGTNILYLK
jgi:hypothetical protein